MPAFCGQTSIAARIVGKRQSKMMQQGVGAINATSTRPAIPSRISRQRQSKADEYLEVPLGSRHFFGIWGMQWNSLKGTWNIRFVK
ncbi:MAG: hypothetical protein Ta2B_02130 [Termitinemataceae bacterium]|nr:MAG: hypothetical protein Ta2B_02130 [Termitinemataceae bacterium]